MAELERILLPLLLLLWSVCLGLAIAFKRFQASSELPVREQSKPTSEAKREQFFNEELGIEQFAPLEDTRAANEHENPYATPLSEAPVAVDLSNLPHNERPPRTGIHFSHRVDLWVALGLIFWYALQIFLGAFVPTEAKITSEGLLDSLAIQAFIMLMLCALVLRRIAFSPGGLRPWLGLDFTPNQLKQTLLWIVPIIGATYAIHWGVQTLLTSLGLELAPQALVEFLAQNESNSVVLAIAFFAIIIAPLSEELIFRGYLYPVLGRFCGRVLSLLLCASFFALVHNSLSSLIGLGFLAIALTWIYERTGSLWSPIFIHAVFNSITVFVLLGHR